MKNMSHLAVGVVVLGLLAGIANAAPPAPARWTVMDRWSRRWESGELNKEHVRSILDEVSARRDWPAGSAEQLSGDFFGACMASR